MTRKSFFQDKNGRKLIAVPERNLSQVTNGTRPNQTRRTWLELHHQLSSLLLLLSYVYGRNTSEQKGSWRVLDIWPCLEWRSQQRILKPSQFLCRLWRYFYIKNSLQTFSRSLRRNSHRPTEKQLKNKRSPFPHDWDRRRGKRRRRNV